MSGTRTAVHRVHRSAVAVLSGASGLQLVANAAAAATATAVLGPGERGVMVLGLTTASIVAVLSVLGTGSSLRARLPTAVVPAARRRLLGAFTWLSVGGLVVAAAGSALLCGPTAGILDPALGRDVVPLAVAAAGAGQVVLLQTTEAWFADGRFRRGGSSAAAVAAGGLLGLLLAAAVSATAGSLLLGQALGQLGVGLVVVGGLRRAGLLVVGLPDGRAARELVAGGAPTLGLTLGLAIALRADRYVLGIASGTAAVGIYSLASTLSETVRLAPQAIGQLFMREAAAGAGPRRLLHRSALAAAVAAVAALGVGAVGWSLVVPLFGPAFAGAAHLLVPLVVAEVALAPYLVASRGILGRGGTVSAALLGVAAGGTAVLGYVLGAAAGGTLGLAVACVAVYGVLSLAAAGTFLQAYRWRPGRHRLRTRFDLAEGPVRS